MLYTGEQFATSSSWNAMRTSRQAWPADSMHVALMNGWMITATRRSQKRDPQQVKRADPQRVKRADPQRVNSYFIVRDACSQGSQ